MTKFWDCVQVFILPRRVHMQFQNEVDCGIVYNKITIKYYPQHRPTHDGDPSWRWHHVMTGGYSSLQRALSRCLLSPVWQACPHDHALQSNHKCPQIMQTNTRCGGHWYCSVSEARDTVNTELTCNSVHVMVGLPVWHPQLTVDRS